MSTAPEELVAQAGLLYADDQLDQAKALLEQAFVGLKDAGALPAAARVAAWLGEIHATWFGNEAVGRGWTERGRRLLDEAGPCVEWGYLELARLACDRPDLDELTASAQRALDVARQFGDVGLEARALADMGLALVTKGQVRDGFALLDESLATLSAGEVQDVWAVGTSLCAVLSSCDRAGDIERAVESIKLAEALLLQPLDGRPKVLSTHCKLAFGSVLCSAGRWSEGEATLLDALGPAASLGHRVEISARLAEVRLYQGRFDDAAELLADIEDHVVAAGAVATLHLHRGETDLAAAVLRTAIKRMVSDVLRGGPLTALLVEAELTRGDVDAARDAASLLRSMANAVETPLIDALAAVAEARVALAADERTRAVDGFERALDVLGDGRHPLLVATIHLDLAGAHDDPAAAVASARAAHAAALRINATVLCDRAAATLRSLGATAPRSTKAADSLAGLTARELDVLAGIQRGDSNAQIAAALFLSPKTVEHHVGRILGKLGVRTRAEAAAVAARTGAT